MALSTDLDQLCLFLYYTYVHCYLISFHTCSRAEGQYTHMLRWEVGLNYMYMYEVEAHCLAATPSSLFFLEVGRKRGGGV